MPYPASYVPVGTPISPKQLNQNLYGDDGTVTGVVSAPTGIQFLARRPILLESVTTFNDATQENFILWLLYGSIGNFTNAYQSFLDSAGVYGRGADSPGGDANYWWQPVVPVSSGTSTGPQFSGAGGWTIMCHFAPVTAGSGQLALGAQFYLAQDSAPNTFTALTTGSFQASAPVHDSCPFVLDLLDTQPAAGQVVTPGVAFTISSATSWTLTVNGTDGSGETPRFFTIWEGASTWNATDVTPPLPAPLTSWTPSSTADSALLNGNRGIADVINFLQYPPMFRSAVGTTQAISSGTNTTQNLAVTPSVDNFSGQDSTTGYTVPADGLYLCHAVTCWAASSSGQRATGITVNSTLYWGPGYEATSSGICMTTKTQIFSLRAGDTLSVTVRQNSGSTLDLSSTHQSRMFCCWLGDWTTPGSVQTTFTPPDPAFRWQAGTQGNALPGLFTEHLASDLGFLTCHPYYLAYQSLAESGFTGNSWNTVTLDSRTGIAHGDNGDPWDGWSSVTGAWLAPVAGWYLVVGELYATAAPGTASVAAGLSVPTSGGYSGSAFPDYYQHQLASTNGSLPPGGTIAGLYYFAEGEFAKPQVLTQDYGTSWGTVANTAADGGTIACHLEIVWLSG